MLAQLTCRMTKHQQCITLKRVFENEFITRSQGFCIISSQKHAYIMLTPLNPTFIFTGDTLFFLFLLKNIDCGYLLELPQ